LTQGEERPAVKSECIIPGIITGAKAVGRRRGREEGVEIPGIERAERVTAAKTTESVAKLFTPTLASRLQTLTGKRVYGPVQGNE
jgi:hypothetical protein